MSSPSFRLRPQHALLLSLAAHGLLLALPLPQQAPGGTPQVIGIGARLPLQVSLRPTSAPEGQSILLAEDADQSVPTAETPAPPERTPPQPAGQKEGDAAQAAPYFPLKALTREPEPTGDLQPQFPPLPGGTGGRGQLTLRVWINAAGGVDRVEAISGTMTEAYRQPVLEAFARMGFRPGEIGGRPVGTWTDVVVEVPTGNP